MQQKNIRKKSYNRTLDKFDTHSLKKNDRLCEFVNNMGFRY